jgi:sugar phosphate isomerase/epimerase
MDDTRPWEVGVISDRISCVDFSFPGSFAGAAASIHDLGIARIDVSVRRERFVLTEPGFVLADPVEAARDRLATLQPLALAVADVFCMSADPDPPNKSDAVFLQRERAVFEAVCVFASRLGASGVTVLPGQRDTVEVRPSAWERAVIELQWRVAHARSVGLQVSVEPHVGSIIDTPATVKSLLGDVPGLALTLDYSHFIYSGMSLDEIHPLLSMTRVLHVRQAAPRRIQTLLETGAIDFARVFAAARNVFVGTISLEYVQHPILPGDSLDVAIESAKLRDVINRELGETAS